MNVNIVAYLFPCRHGLVQMDKREMSHVATTFEHLFVYSCKFATGKGYESQRCSSSMPLLSWIFTCGQMRVVHVAMTF